MEAPLHPSLGLGEVCWRLLWCCVLWAVISCCTLVLKRWLGRRQTARAHRSGSEMLAERESRQTSWVARDTSPGRGVSLPQALADCMLLCVLQEPLSQPTLPHIRALLARLKSVSQALQRTPALLGSASRDDDPALVDKVKALSNYLQQRTGSLRGLLQVQGRFEASVEDLQRGMDSLWSQLVELHTRVTLTKDWSPGGGDLAATRAEAENLSSVLGQYKSRLQSCLDLQRDSTRLLQEVTWSHAHFTSRVSDGCNSESVWPELLLQSNIEQFDKVQENFQSLDQQTCTFQAHLDGLVRGAPDRQTVSQAHGPSSSGPASPQNVPSKCEPSAPSTDDPSPRTLCERSGLQFSTAIGRLRRSGRRK